MSFHSPQKHRLQVPLGAQPPQWQKGSGCSAHLVPQMANALLPNRNGFLHV